jgi:hypothetical protein
MCVCVCVRVRVRIYMYPSFLSYFTEMWIFSTETKFHENPLRGYRVLVKREFSQMKQNFIKIRQVGAEFYWNVNFLNWNEISSKYVKGAPSFTETWIFSAETKFLQNPLRGCRVLLKREFSRLQKNSSKSVKWVPSFTETWIFSAETKFH